MKKMNDAYVESVIKKAIGGFLTTGQAAASLMVTKQYVNKLKKEYRSRGSKAFKHGNAGKSRPWKTDESVEKEILRLYDGPYSGFNFTHFREKLEESHGIKIGYRPLYRILTSAGKESPRRRRKRRQRAKHPSRPRRQRFGELLQIDGSVHAWFGEGFPKATLHGAIDDATGTVMGLRFDAQETLAGYFAMLRQILLKYGIPAAFYSDNRTCFEYRKLAERDKTIDRDTNIQFRRACIQLGIEIITTSVSQAKGRVERLWETMQDRLISELRLRGITTVEGANAYLPEFMADYNRRFALPIDPESSLFVPAPSPKEIDFYLSVEYERIADSGSAISLKGKRLQLVGEFGEIAAVPQKESIDVYVTMSGRTVAVWDGKLWDTVEVEKRKPKDDVGKSSKKGGRPCWKPGPNHPWRKFTIKPKKP